MSMFQRMFGIGRRRSPVEGEGSQSSETEATAEKPDEVNADGFVMFGDTASQSNSVFDPAPGYTLGGANAFLPYGIDPRAAVAANLPSSDSAEPQSAIDGIPFKIGSKVLLEGNIQQVDLSSTIQLIQKINQFNWDDYEYNFQLERSIIQEFNAPEQEQTSE